MSEIIDAKSLHAAHRELLVALFRQHPHEVLTHQELEELVGRNYQQRISEARVTLSGEGLIENVPQRDADGKRLTGHYVYRPNAQGRDASEILNRRDSYTGPLFDTPGAYRS